MNDTGKKYRKIYEFSANQNTRTKKKYQIKQLGAETHKFSYK